MNKKQMLDEIAAILRDEETSYPLFAARKIIEMMERNEGSEWSIVATLIVAVQLQEREERLRNMKRQVENVEFGISMTRDLWTVEIAPPEHEEENEQ